VLPREWLLSRSGVHIWMRPCLSTVAEVFPLSYEVFFFVISTCLSYFVSVIQRGVRAYMGRVHIYEKLGLIEEDLESHWYKCLLPRIGSMHAHFFVSQLLDTAYLRCGGHPKHGVYWHSPPLSYSSHRLWVFDVIRLIVIMIIVPNNLGSLLYCHGTPINSGTTLVVSLMSRPEPDLADMMLAVRAFDYDVTFDTFTYFLFL
jgi:hypothetical protein